ncbi:hypothetical protein ACH0BF_07330 [Pseudobacillus sp. 179-B 2D1 NHS]|uniref:hypothetical protein n=1 Tax=Pseudobacillus sp. 179-B 2D1 NHS TaxID=3374292 RepID=UPI00387A2603
MRGKEYYSEEGIPIRTSIILCGSLIVTLAGCNSISSTEERPVAGQEDPSHSESHPGNDQPPAISSGQKSALEDQKLLTPEEVIQATKKQLHTTVPVQLPKSMDISVDHHLTAETSSRSNEYTIQFIEMNEPVPINNDALKNEEANVAVLRGMKYNSMSTAAKQINYQDHSDSEGEAVDLGFGIKGYKDAGAGSQFIGWNEGRWSLAMRALTEQGDDLEAEAKKVVQYLEKHTLPVPHEAGMVMLDISKTGGEHVQRVAWQENNAVYEIETPKGYMEALKVAVSIQQNH